MKYVYKLRHKGASIGDPFENKDQKLTEHLLGLGVIQEVFEKKKGCSECQKKEVSLKEKIVSLESENDSLKKEIEELKKQIPTINQDNKNTQ